LAFNDAFVSTWDVLNLKSRTPAELPISEIRVFGAIRVSHAARADRRDDLLRNKKTGIDKKGLVRTVFFFEFLLWITPRQRALRL